jgi:molybdopterin synthase sulfur carrier subunit
MPTVCLRGPLKRLAGDRAEHAIAADTVLESVRGLERAYPTIAGWILDERGLIRQHINVFVNGERVTEGTAVANDDRVDILPAISGG